MYYQFGLQFGFVENKIPQSTHDSFYQLIHILIKFLQPVLFYKDEHQYNLSVQLVI